MPHVYTNLYQQEVVFVDSRRPIAASQIDVLARVQEARERIVLGQARLASDLQVVVCKHVGRLQQMAHEMDRKDQLISSLKAQLEHNAAADLNSSVLLEASNHISAQEARVYLHNIAELKKEVEEAKKGQMVAKRQLDLEKLRCQTQERELARRKEQVREGVETIAKLKEQLKSKSTTRIGDQEMPDGDSTWDAREQRLRHEMQERAITDQSHIAALETKLAMRRRELRNVQNALQAAEQLHAEEIGELNARLEKCQMQLKDAIEESARRERTAIEKSAELAALRARLDVSTPLRGARRTESMEDVLLSQIKALTAQIEQMKAPPASGNVAEREYVEGLQRKVGSLTATNSFLEQQMQTIVTRERTLDQDLSLAKEEIQSLKAELERVQKQMIECGNDAELTHKFLVDETSKIKQQKAQLRCDYLELKRQNAKLQAEIEKYGENNTSNEMVEDRLSKATRACEKAAEEKAALSAQMDVLKCQLETAKKDVVEARAKITALESSSAEERAADDARVQQMKGELLALSARYTKLQHAAELVDKQCDQLTERVKAAEAGRAKALEQSKRLAVELEAIRRECDEQRVASVDAQAIEKERDRLQQKCDYLHEELLATHTDYREELTRLARQMSESKQRDASENESFSVKSGLLLEVRELQTQLRQQETEARAMQRQMQQAIGERDAHAVDLNELRGAHAKLLEENGKLRRGIEESLRKIERYKDDAEAARGINEKMAADIAAMQEKTTSLESRLGDVRDTLEEKERLIGYLQSQIELKRAQKCRPSTSQSTLISSSAEEDDVLSSVPSIDQRPLTINDLEQQRDLLRRDLDTKKEVLARRRGSSEDEDEAVPLLRYPPKTATPGTPKTTRTPLSQRNAIGGSVEALTVSGVGTPPPPGARVGTMRHDIPHRWKTYLILKQAKCAVCMEGLPRVRHALKCVECGVLIHRQCSPLIAHTCGLPSQCADFYIDSSQTNQSNGGGGNRMVGWVKIWRSDELASSRWRSAWASMDEQHLSFYNTENLAANDGSAIMTIDLDTDTWRFVHQRVNGDDESVKQFGHESIARMIELKLTGCRLYLLAPTVQARQRWVQALQIATTRRMFVQRRPSAQPAQAGIMLGLDAPHNLAINCCLIVNEWLLLGCQEGLFITQITSMHMPFNIAGFSAVYQLEQCTTAEMVLAITGSQRTLALLHLRQLHVALASKHPAIQATPVPGMQNCHLLMLHEDKYGRNDGPKHLCVADPDRIHVLQFNSRMGVFTPYQSVAAKEPPTCLLSTPNGFIFGADCFYSVDFGQMLARPVVVSGCTHDFPLAAVRVSQGEILLAFHNYGVFVDLNCSRTRRENVDWNRAPLEFVFTDPYLYVVHFESLEILQVAPYEDENSPGFLDEREIYRCSSAHHAGYGRNRGDVIFALSRRDRTEVHVFNACAEQKKGASLKRKQQNYAEVLQRQTSLEKRTRN